jgi:hypothetical protein
MDATTVDLVTDAAVRAAHAEMLRLGVEGGHVLVLAHCEPVPADEQSAGVAAMRSGDDPDPDGPWIVEQLLTHAQRIAEATGQGFVRFDQVEGGGQG